jgi:hypothetical protein
MAGRRLRLVCVAMLFAAVVALATGGASSGAKMKIVHPKGDGPKHPDLSKVVFPPFGFKLAATNGYVLEAVPARKHQLLVIAGQPNRQSVFYIVPATSANPFGAIQADLGFLLKIDVTFQPNGKKWFGDKCLGFKSRYLSGTYTGTIEFHGENGYSDAVATAAPSISPGGECITFGSVSGGGLGAEVIAKNSDGSARLKVLAHRRGAPPGFQVTTYEQSGPVGIIRSLIAKGPAGSFVFDAPRNHASITTSPPLHGSASFKRTSRRGGSWLGDLTVDMPGRPGVPLAGDDFSARLLRLDYSGSLLAARPQLLRSAGFGPSALP